MNEQMTITLTPDLASALVDVARQRGVTPQALAIETLRSYLAKRTTTLRPQDDWERSLLALATDCGVSLSNEDLRRENIY